MKITPYCTPKIPWFKELGGAVLLLCAALVMVLPFSAESGEAVGKIAKQRHDVYGTPPAGDRERKFPRYDVVFGELIETSGGGALLIRMLDKTELYMGERARLTIDEFVYDPATNKGDAVFNFTIGTLRFVSGTMETTAVTIQTPGTHIGIRGSEAIIFVTPDGDTFVNVFKGRFSVRSRDHPDKPEVTVDAGRNVSVSRSVGFSTIGTGIKIPEYSHAPDAKVPDFSDDLMDLKHGGGLDKAREGRNAGERGGDDHGDGHGDHDGHD